MNFPLCLCELLDVVDFISLLFYSLLLFIYFLPAYEIICLFFELLMFGIFGESSVREN